MTTGILLLAATIQSHAYGQFNQSYYEGMVCDFSFGGFMVYNEDFLNIIVPYNSYLMMKRLIL